MEFSTRFPYSEWYFLYYFCGLEMDFLHLKWLWFHIRNPISRSGNTETPFSECKTKSTAVICGKIASFSLGCGKLHGRTISTSRAENGVPFKISTASLYKLGDKQKLRTKLSIYPINMHIGEPKTALTKILAA